MTDIQSDMTRTGGETSPGTVRVWDPLVRIFHWSLVVLFFFSFATGDEWDKAHIYAGYTVAALVAFRIIWGLVGTRHARFSDFVYSPAAVIGFLVDTMRFRAKRYLGHNPAGGMMVLALLAAITVISVTGHMMRMDAYWGAEWVEELHEMAVYGTLFLIILHIGGVILASFEHRENLVRSMFTGRKKPL